MAPHRPAWILLLLTAFALAGCSDDSGDTDAPATSGGAGGNGGNGGGGGASGSSGAYPDLDVGDRWTHKMAASGYETTMASEVKAIEQHAGFSAYRIGGTMTTNAGGATSSADSTTWIRESDGASLETRTNSKTSFNGQTMESSSTTVFNPPCETFHWPISTGQTWESTCRSTTTTDGGESQETSTTIKYSVGSKESVSVAAGTFQAFKVTATLEGHDSFHWVDPDLCGGLVKTSATAPGQSQSFTLELQSYDC